MNDVRTNRIAQKYLSSPHGAGALDELRRYPHRTRPFNWDPKNVHFGKRHFNDLNISTRTFGLIAKIEINTGTTCFVFFTKVPKTTHKKGLKFKQVRNLCVYSRPGDWSDRLYRANQWRQ